MERNGVVTSCGNAGKSAPTALSATTTTKTTNSTAYKRKTQQNNASAMLKKQPAQMLAHLYDVDEVEDDPPFAAEVQVHVPQADVEINHTRRMSCLVFRHSKVKSETPL